MSSSFCVFRQTGNGIIYLFNYLINYSFNYLIPNVVFILCFLANRKWNYFHVLMQGATSYYSCQSTTDLQGGNTLTYIWFLKYLII